MARNEAILKTESLDISDDDTEALFASPSRSQGTKPTKSNIQEPVRQHLREQGGHGDDYVEAHEAILRKELAGLRKINQVIEGAINSLGRASTNMDTVSCTVKDASALLNTWTRVLSQTEHNQRLILDPSWHGATQDLTDIENESIAKQQERERWELEEAQKREARARKFEEEERRKAETVGLKTPRAGRGKGRVTSKGTGLSRTTGYVASVAPAKDASSRAGRAGSGIGRGPNGHRGRSRGT